MCRYLTLLFSVIMASLYGWAVDFAATELRHLPKVIDIDSAELAEAYPLGKIDGIWQFSQDGGAVAITPVSEADLSHGFVIVALEAADRTILPGTVMGVIHPSALTNTYDAEIYTESVDGVLQKPKKFILTLRDDNHLSFVPVKNRLKVNLRSLLPYMFRVSVSRQTNRSVELDGALRVSRSPGKPLNPAVL